MRRIPVIFSMLILTTLAVFADDLPTLDIKEWPVPWEKTQPRDPYVDGQGRVWFVGQRGHYVAYLNPATGEFKRIDLEPGTGPHNLIVDKKGHVWYAGNRAAHIGRIDPDTGERKKYAMPDPAAKDPHTLTFDRKGDIWFTVQGGNFVGKLETASGKVHLVKVPTPDARPYGIVMSSKDEPWIVLFGTNKLATVNPKTMALREIELPRAEARPRRLVIDSKDRVWYGDYAKGYLGMYDTASGKFEEWASPSGTGSRPYGMSLDSDDVVWYVETGVQPNRFIGFNPRTRAFVSNTAIPSGGGVVRHMFYQPKTGEIWFGTDTQNIARARVPKRGS